MERLALLGVERYGTVHILHSFSSVPVGRYSTYRRLLDFSGDLSTEVLFPVADIHVSSFVVLCAVFAVLREATSPLKMVDEDMQEGGKEYRE